MGNSFGWTYGSRRFVRILFCPVRPGFFRWIGLFPLDVGHLAEWMLFAGYAKEQYAKRYTNNALADEASHNALPQLSVSNVACKDESAARR